MQRYIVASAYSHTVSSFYLFYRYYNRVCNQNWLGYCQLHSNIRILFVSPLLIPRVMSSSQLSINHFVQSFCTHRCLTYVYASPCVDLQMTLILQTYKACKKHGYYPFLQTPQIKICYYLVGPIFGHFVGKTLSSTYRYGYSKLLFFIRKLFPSFLLRNTNLDNLITQNQLFLYNREYLLQALKNTHLLYSICCFCCIP